jgi:hypothetical protein
MEARVGIELRRHTQAAYLIETTMLTIRTMSAFHDSIAQNPAQGKNRAA